jgi:biotin carboxylase
VLVGFADALAAPEAAASLLGAGYRVVSFARRGRPVALRRMRGVEIVEVSAPERDLGACERELATIASAHDVIMPLDDAAVFVCDASLPVDAPVAGPRGSQARLALDKREQLRAAAAAGFEVPTWRELGEQSDIPEDLELPAMLKPALAAEAVDGRLRRRSPRAVATSADLLRELRGSLASSPVILQRWVPGGGAGVFGLADGGGVHHLSAHRRVRMMNPAGSGSSACVSAPVSEMLRGPVARLLEAANWRGMFMVELLHSEDRWWFVELNGRPWGSLALARRLGYEYPAWAVRRLLDDKAALPEAPAFAELECRHLGRELVHLLVVLKGPRSHVGAWPGRGETLHAVLKPGPRTSWYNLAPGMRGVFVEDTWRTLADQTFRRRRG